MSEPELARGPESAGDSVEEVVLRYEDFRLRPHNCFACGELNDAGLRLKLHLSPDRCWTELTASSRYEGWEGVIHGGIVSTILDEVMGWALIARDSWGVTARFSIQFKKPVTVGRTIRAEAWVTGTRRRLQEVEGHIVDAETGEELATAQAIYVAAPEAKKREQKARYKNPERPA